MSRELLEAADALRAATEALIARMIKIDGRADDFGRTFEQANAEEAIERYDEARRAEQ